MRERGYPWSWKNAIGVLLLIWSGTSLLSFPWAAIFWARARHPVDEANAKIAETLRYIGVGVLGFLACGLLEIGYALPAYYFEAPDDIWGPFLAFLLVALGIGVGLAAIRIAAHPALKEAV
ncbi:MAG TPA: hypothetical protein VJN21_09520 [Candidatus Acidoferrales bacterium]|nr:hypothetical protein [Candidatus Acidoferrales bacterium]